MEKGKRKYLLNIFLLLALVVGIFYFMVKDHINEVTDILSTMGTREFVALFVVLFSNILVSGLIMTTLARKFDKNYSIMDGAKAHLISNMFTSITPMGIACYPSLMYVYRKQKMNTEESISMIAIEAMVRQIFVSIACLLITMYFISNPLIATIGSNKFSVSTLCIILCSFNVILSIAVVSMCLSKRIHRFLSKIVYFFIRLFYRKEKEETMLLKFEEKIDEIEDALHVVLNNKVLLFKQLVLNFIRSLILYGTPYLIYLLLNKNVRFDMDSFIWWYMAMMSVVFMSRVFPIPGGSIAVETFSTIILTSVLFTEAAMLSSIIILWRFFSHYGVVALGALAMLSPIKRENRSVSMNMIVDHSRKIVETTRKIEE